MIVLGLGSNVGDRLAHLRKAIDLLGFSGAVSPVKIKKISPIYESDALLPEGLTPEQAVAWNQPFLNLALLCESGLSPSALLLRLKQIEAEIGRESRGRWAPREIDIDFLAYGTDVIAGAIPTQECTVRSYSINIPHPQLVKRPFVILPFADVVPDWRHPAFTQTASELAGAWRYAGAEEVPFRTRRSPLALSELIGIVNVTPDSFSDGGKFLSPDEAIKQACALAQAGATIIDLGAESTRPKATPLTPEQEWQRLEPILKKLPAALKAINPFVKISLDTRHAATAEKALALDVNIINDVSGLADPNMPAVLASAKCDVVFMHNLTVPADPAVTLANDRDPSRAVLEWAHAKIEALNKVGIPSSRLIFDPGLGFGKTAEQSWHLLRSLQCFHDLGVRLYVGHSRKSFLQSVTPRPAPERDFESAVLTPDLLSKGARYIRIHDAETHARAMQTWLLADGVMNLGD